jgi:hypothetical protein
MTVAKFQEMLLQQLDECINTEIETHSNNIDVLCVEWKENYYDSVETVKDIKQTYHAEQNDTIKHIYPDDEISSNDSTDENPTIYYRCE